MIGFYDYTVWLTYIGFMSSLGGLILAFKDRPFLAIVCLMFSGLCDMFDGRVARTKKRRSANEITFGMQIDSLSDLLCFGVLPSIIGYNIGITSPIMIPILLFYPLAALIRLAYFNVLEIQRNSSAPVKAYTGLPVTSSALVFPFIYIFKRFLGPYFVLLYTITLILLGTLFISKIKIKKPSVKTMLLFILVGVLEVIIIFTLKLIK